VIKNNCYLPREITLKKFICILCFIWFSFPATTIFAQSTPANPANPENSAARSIDNITSQIQQFKRNKPLWSYDYISELQNIPPYDIKTFYALSGLEEIKKTKVPGPVVALLLSSFLIYRLYRFFLSNFFLSKLKKKSLFIKNIIPSLLLFLSFLLLSLIFLFTFKENINSNPILYVFIKSFTLGFFALLFVKLNTSYALPTMTQHKQLYLTKIFKKLSLIIILLVIARMVKAFFQGQLYPSFFAIITTTLYLMLLYPIIIGLISNGLNLNNKKAIKSNSIIITLSVFVFSSLLFKAVSGLNEAVFFLTLGIVQSLMVIAFSLTVVYYLWSFNRILGIPTHPISIMVHNRMGLPANKRLTEASILCVLLTLASIRFIAIRLRDIWNVPKEISDATFNYIKHNLYISNIHINIPGITRGLILFCLFLLLGRILGVLLSKRKSFHEQKQTQVTIITLSNYIAFSLGIITLLLNAGVNLSGFAMVASALSVGIGFGLKNFAADLIAGLILLISKPLRPGDHIKVEAHEGFIQKINLLSTIIKTLKESDIIVPNGILLSQSVTNYTYANKFLGITSDIMIQNTADVERAKKILLDVAKTHPELHQRGKKKPFIMVDLSADKTLNIILTLHCTVKDVNQELHIKSSINSDILTALRKHKIALKT
jgi:potassium-dependent mechanosensitive channel